MKKRTGVHLSYAANLSKVWGPPLIIGQAELLATELLLENAVFFLKVFDDRILLTGDPTGHSSDEDLPGLKDGGHPSIVATPRNNRQLSAGGETG